MKNGVFVTKDKVKAMLAALSILPSKEVLVGFPHDGSSRNDGTPLSNAELGYIHNFGAPEANIPQREFMAPGIAAVQDRITALFAQAGKASLAGKPDQVDKILHAIGLTAKAGVQNKLNQGPFLPLAPATLRARRARGRSGSKPLIDTGQLRNAVTYVVRRRK